MTFGHDTFVFLGHPTRTDLNRSWVMIRCMANYYYTTIFVFVKESVADVGGNIITTCVCLTYLYSTHEYCGTTSRSYVHSKYN